MYNFSANTITKFTSQAFLTIWLCFRFIVLSGGNSNGFVKDASLILASKRKTADYDVNMDADLFKKWLKGDRGNFWALNHGV